MYPEQFRLPQVTEHVLAWLERRRPGFGEWNAEVEAQLTAEARRALEDVARRFSDLAVDPTYWRRLEHSILTVVLPRYYQVAREHHELQRRKYDLWRGGDVVSRAAYTVAGIVAALLVAATRIPNWLEFLPFFFILFGPFLPDMQAGYFERRYRRQLATLVEDMRLEQKQLEAYQPLDEPAPALEPLSAPEPEKPVQGEAPSKEKT